MGSLFLCWWGNANIMLACGCMLKCGSLKLLWFPATHHHHCSKDFGLANETVKIMKQMMVEILGKQTSLKEAALSPYPTATMATFLTPQRPKQIHREAQEQSLVLSNLPKCRSWRLTESRQVWVLMFALIDKRST